MKRITLKELINYLDSLDENVKNKILNYIDISWVRKEDLGGDISPVIEGEEVLFWN